MLDKESLSQRIQDEFEALGAAPGNEHSWIAALLMGLRPRLSMKYRKTARRLSKAAPVVVTIR
jgi:hypothetical protein